MKTTVAMFDNKTATEWTKEHLDELLSIQAIAMPINNGKQHKQPDDADILCEFMNRHQINSLKEAINRLTPNELRIIRGAEECLATSICETYNPLDTRICE